MHLSIQKQNSFFKLYNCGYGRMLSVNALVALIIQKSGKQLSIAHATNKPTIKTSLCLDCSLAEKELGWKPKVSLEEGIKLTIAWWSKNIRLQNTEKV